MGKIIQCYAYGCFCFRDPVIFAEGKTELNPAKGKPAQPDFNIYGIMGNHKTCKTWLQSRTSQEFKALHFKNGISAMPYG